MKLWLRYFALAAALTGTPGCSKKEEASTAVAVQAVSRAELFSYIPSDTSYLWISTEPMPKALLEKLLVAFWLEGEPSGFTSPVMQYLHASMKKLGQIKTVGDLEARGISGQMAVYEIAGLPILRIGLSDAEKMRAYLKRLEQQSTDTWEQKRLGDQAFFGLSEQSSESIELVVAIVKDELVLSLMPKAFEEPVLKVAFLQEKPAQKGLDAQQMQALAKDWGFRYGAGYVDFRHLFDKRMGCRQGTEAQIRKSFLKAEQVCGTACYREISQLLQKAPRAVFGLAEVTPKRFTSRIGLELEPALAETLRALTTDGEGLAPEGRILDFSLGFNLQKAVETFTPQWKAISAAPYQCDNLSLLSDLAALGSTLDQADFWPKLQPAQALSVGFDALTPQKEDLPQIEAYAALMHGHPEELFKWISVKRDQDSETQKLAIKPDGQWVDLTEQFALLGWPNALSLSARMTEKALGFALGAGSRDRLTASLQKKAEPGTLATLSFDVAQTKQAFWNYLTLQGETEGASPPGFLVWLQMLQGFNRVSLALKMTHMGLTLDWTSAFR